jgi:hypothetical protein
LRVADLNKVYLAVFAGKQSKRLYGLPLMVYSPKVLADKERAIIILRVGAYAEEIKRGILEVRTRSFGRRSLKYIIAHSP